jgi:hypothetical protein
MNPEQQRIAIAEACGWTEIERINSGEFGGLRGVKPNGGRWIVPSYCRDLNAMHEAETVLNYEQFDEYYIQLAMKMSRPFHATAAQRAEAFLKTLSLWRD